MFSGGYEGDSGIDSGGDYDGLVHVVNVALVLVLNTVVVGGCRGGGGDGGGDNADGGGGGECSNDGNRSKDYP